MELRQNLPPKFAQPRSREKPIPVDGTKKESEPTMSCKIEGGYPKEHPTDSEHKRLPENKQDARECRTKEKLMCLLFSFVFFF